MLESGSWGHSVLQTPALVLFIYFFLKKNKQTKTHKFMSLAKKYACFFFVFSANHVQLCVNGNTVGL